MQWNCIGDIFGRVADLVAKQHVALLSRRKVTGPPPFEGEKSLSVARPLRPRFHMPEVVSGPPATLTDSLNDWSCSSARSCSDFDYNPLMPGTLLSKHCCGSGQQFPSRTTAPKPVLKFGVEEEA